MCCQLVDAAVYSLTIAGLIKGQALLITEGRYWLDVIQAAVKALQASALIGMVKSC